MLSDRVILRSRRMGTSRQVWPVDGSGDRSVTRGLIVVSLWPPVRLERLKVVGAWRLLHIVRPRLGRAGEIRRRARAASRPYKTLCTPGSRTYNPAAKPAGRPRASPSSSRPGLSRAAARTRRERLLRGVLGSRVYGQDSGLCGLWSAVCIHRQRAGLLRPARLLGTQEMRPVSQRPQGIEARGRRGPSRRFRRRIRSGPAPDVRGHLQSMRQGDRSAVPSD
jgi:hypothetical protein